MEPLKTSLRFKLWGWNMEKLVVFYTPDFTNISPAKGRLEDDVPPFFGGHSFIFGRGISSKRSPLMSFKNYLMHKVLQ